MRYDSWYDMDYGVPPFVETVRQGVRVEWTWWGFGLRADILASGKGNERVYTGLDFLGVQGISFRVSTAQRGFGLGQRD